MKQSYIIFIIFMISLSFFSCNDEEIKEESCKGLPDRTYDTSIERYPWAGSERFYKMDPGLLCDKTHSIYAQVEKKDKIENAIMVISPHAGWQYAGIVTASALSRIDIPNLVIIIGPNHKNNGKQFAVWPDLPWAFPFGNVPIDTDLAQRFINETTLLESDRDAHLEEHSDEMQVLWLQYLNPNIKIVPISINYTSSYSDLSNLGTEIGNILATVNEPFLIIATTHLTHYEPVDYVKSQDAFVIEPMLEKDPEGLFNAKVDHNVSMCGREPVVVGIQAALTLGATKTEQIMYRTSYDQYQSGWDNAVGYVSIVYSK